MPYAAEFVAWLQRVHLSSKTNSPQKPWQREHNHQQPSDSPLQLLNRYLVIGIDAHLARNLQSFFGDLAGRELGVFG